jgi:hypothetical protein
MGRSLSNRLIAVAGLAVGCGGGEDPTGTTTIQVEGRVISARSRAGIAGAEINIGGFLSNDFVITTTGSDGSFAASVESFGCEGDIIFVIHSGYLQPAPFPNVCPGSSRTIELDPKAISSVIRPQDPMTTLGGTVDFQVRVTFFDGTVEDPGEVVWFVAPSGPIDGPECGSVPDVGPVRATTYTAPSSQPPAQCGPASGHVAVGAAPVEGTAGATLEVSDTVVVTVTP